MLTTMIIKEQKSQQSHWS